MQYTKKKQNHVAILLWAFLLIRFECVCRVNDISKVPNFFRYLWVLPKIIKFSE